MALTRIILATETDTTTTNFDGDYIQAAIALDYDLVNIEHKIEEFTSTSNKHTFTYTYNMSMICLTNDYFNQNSVMGWTMAYLKSQDPMYDGSINDNDYDLGGPEPDWVREDYDIYHSYGYIVKDHTVTISSVYYLSISGDEAAGTTTGTFYWGLRNRGGSTDPFRNATGTFKLTLSPNGSYKANLTAASTFYAGGNPWITYSIPTGGTDLITSLQVGVTLDATGEQMLDWHDVPIESYNTYTVPLTDEERTRILQLSANFTNATITYTLKSTIDGVDFYSDLSRSFIVSSSGTAFNITIADVNTETLALTGNPQRLIRYFSDVEYNMGLEPDQEATIKSVTAVNGSQVLHEEEGRFENVEKADFVFTCTDSRDIVTTETVTMVMVNYKKLTCNLKVDPPTGEGKTTIAVFGNLYKMGFGNSGLNSDSFYVMYRYKEKNGVWSDWITLDHLLSNVDGSDATNGEDYYASIDISGLDYLKSYVFQARAVDLLMTVDTPEKVIATVPLFDWSEGDFNFNVPVTVTNESGYVFNLSGAARALQQTFTLSTDYTPGANYSAASGTDAVLLGTNLRCYIYATRKTATGAGNVANEVVASVKIHHGGKINSAYRICFCNGATGGVALFQTTNEENDGTYLTFDIQLLSTGGASTEFSAFFVIPCMLNLEKY